MTAATPQSRPRLTRLELHGFKSFAAKTLFQFEPGITAVVGPNGSGKSNISDAVRWVLGESSYSALRSKRTEDVIFAGGRGKSPAGMAEVTVTFDNEDHWLPSEFVEVTVTRRAFRSGENQYFINNRRVRLKDVAALTASLGQSHTVVGQGMVDAALSQRAEERRSLFEHAADLTGLRIKVQEAERNLAESDANSERLVDLLAEVEPNVRRLERAARQAREWQELSERLRGMQRGHYRRLLVAASERLVSAETGVAERRTALNAARSALEEAAAVRRDQAATLASARERLEIHDARLETLRDQVRRVSHERELVRERQRALARRRDDMAETHATLEEQVTAVQARLAASGEAMSAIDAEIEQADAAVRALRRFVDQAREERSARERRVEDLARKVTARERALGDLRARRALQVQRMESGSAERERVASEQAARLKRIDELEAELQSHQQTDRELTDDIHRHTARVEAMNRQTGQLQAAAEAAAAARAEAERAWHGASNRLEVLQRLHESGSNLHAGVRRVMEWHRSGVLDGIRGTVQELISVEPRFDTAIEVALGGRLQDIVVATWRDADAAIQRLKQERAGRVTFQPIDTVRQRSRPTHLPRELEGRDGVFGIAANLIRADDDTTAVIQGLLGRTVVVDDLATSRVVMGDLPNGWNTVTLAGEIARSGGSVTGGSAVRESGALGRERELRDLPAEIGRWERERDAAIAQADALAVELRDQHDALRAEEGALAGLRAQIRERASHRSRLDGWLGDIRQQHADMARREDAAAASRTGQERELAELDAEQDEAARVLRELEADLLAARSAVDTSMDHADDAALADARQTLATLQERRRAEERAQGALRSQRTGLTEELQARVQRAAELEGERDALGSQRTRLDREVSSLQTDLETATAERKPLEHAVRAADDADRATGEAIEGQRQEVMQLERDAGQAELIAERARDEHGAIARRIQDDLNYEQAHDLLADGDAHIDVALPDDHDAAEREIQRMRNRLNRVGWVGDDVVEEHRRETERFAFLTAQLEDIRQASASLRELLAGLHGTMQERFETTFARVAEAFTASFTVLFGGGTARLVLTADEEGAPGGIDIVAQPPGKRLQSLGLLSGGERSLTAVALLFAILQVNPTPFVLLDEVDAALDEANVVRFRDELRKLADATQAIVITHNRGTVEIADTLYGVTMGGDGISQVLSLRLTELPLDGDADVRDLASIAAGVPRR